MDPVLSPLLNIPILWAIVIISLVISVLVTVIYKYTTDQNLMKRLKTEMKELQAEIKSLKDKPQEAMKVQQKAMETNMKYMMQSFKSTLFTIVPVILIFGWFNANLAFEPISPGEEFTVTALMGKDISGNVGLTVPEGVKIVGEAEKEIVDGVVTWTLSGEEEGDYVLEFRYNNEVEQKDLKIDSQRYAEAIEKYKSAFKTITINYEKVHPFGSFSIFGWNPGWLGTYIIFSIIFSMTLRKLLKVY